MNDLVEYKQSLNNGFLTEPDSLAIDEENVYEVTSC